MGGKLRLTRRRFLQCAAGTALGGGGLTLDATVVEPRRLCCETFQLPVPNLPAEFAGLRLVQLSDLHYRREIPLERIRRICQIAMDLEPDMIVCTGDYVGRANKREIIDAVWGELAKLQAPLGVFSVLGNHDFGRETEHCLHWLEKSGQDLNHKKKRIERNGQAFWLAGAGDLWQDHQDLDELLAGIPEQDCRIVLAHNPDTEDKKRSARVDLMLCGHSHGGQVRLPFIGAPVLPVRNKNYDSGLKISARGTRVFISRGTGWSILPIRFCCPPQIAILELLPAG